MSGEHSFSLILPTPLPGGLRIGLRCLNGELERLELLEASTPLQGPRDACALRWSRWLERYFTDPANTPAPEELPEGSDFDRLVWRTLGEISAGETRCYGELALQLKSSARAVAGACRRNPWPLIHPCHRVVSVSGSGGYLGRSDEEALAIKRWLLDHERC